MSVDSPKLFFFRLGVGFRVSNVVSTVCKQWEIGWINGQVPSWDWD